MNDKLKTFLKRLLSTAGLLLVAGGALAGTYCWDNPWFCAGFICLLCNWAYVEWFCMLRRDKSKCNRWLILIGGLLYPWLAAIQPSNGFYLCSIVVFSLIAFVCELVRMDYLKQEASDALRSIGVTILAFIYPGWLFAFALSYTHPTFGLPVLLVLILITKLSDMWAYLVGVWIGGRFISRPFSPAVSPKKSWEGIIGSFILTTLSSVFLTRFVDPASPTLFAAIASAIIFVISVAGDLAGSLIKRGLGVKDSSNLLPGIGGVIDLIDSPAFTIGFVSAICAPAFL